MEKSTQFFFKNKKESPESPEKGFTTGLDGIQREYSGLSYQFYSSIQNGRKLWNLIL